MRNIATTANTTNPPTQLEEACGSCVSRNAITPPPLTPQHNPGHDFSDIERMASDSENRRFNHIVTRQVWTHGSGPYDGFLMDTTGQASRDGKALFGGLSAVTEVCSQRYQKRIRAKIRVWFNIFGPQFAEFEVAIQFLSRAWLSPTLKATIRCSNIRPCGSPIFDACMEGDLDGVTRLIESGAANINAVDDRWRLSCGPA